MATRKPRFIAGGPPEDDEQQQVDDTPRRLRYPCKANGCPMTGAIFLTGTDGPGICAYHYATNASDWPRITQALTDWQCVSFEINEARRVLTDQDLCTDVKAQNDFYRAAWKRLEPALEMGGWKDLKPGPGEDYSQWAKRLQEFLGGRVMEVVRHQFGRQAA